MTYLLSFVIKRRSNFGYESSHILKGRVIIGDFLLGGVFLFRRDVVMIFFFFFFCIFFSSLSLLDTLFFYISLVTT